MDFANIVYSKSEGIATIRLNRPDKINSLSIATWAELNTALSDAEADNEVKAVILTGAGRAFSAGDDIEEFAQVAESVSSIHSYTRKVLAGMLQIEKLAKPVIAAVNGVAMGGGFELVLAADIAIASERAKFGLPEGRIGAIAGFAVHRLPQLIGTKKAMELLLTGDSIDAQEAYRLGIVNKVVPDQDLEAEARAAAKRITNSAPLAAMICKGLVNKNAGGEEVEETLTAACMLLNSDDFKEGFNAFLSKRSPQFRGN